MFLAQFVFIPSHNREGRLTIINAKSIWKELKLISWRRRQDLKMFMSKTTSRLESTIIDYQVSTFKSL